MGGKPSGGTGGTSDIRYSKMPHILFGDSDKSSIPQYTTGRNIRTGGSGDMMLVVSDFDMVRYFRWRATLVANPQEV